MIFVPVWERLFGNCTLENNGCWNWSLRKQKDGYGTIKVGRDSRLAHRESFVAFVGPIPAGYYVLHRCDNPACINPNHLELGDQFKNMQDMVARGRKNKSSVCKLTHEQVIQIKSIGNSMTRRAIAKIFNVTPECISSIMLGKTKRYVG